MVLGIIEGKKVKITYEAYNANEKLDCEIFDGEKLNHVLSIQDLGIEPNSSRYVHSEESRRIYSEKIINIAISNLNVLLK